MRWAGMHAVRCGTMVFLRKPQKRGSLPFVVGLHPGTATRNIELRLSQDAECSNLS